jgi:hypothetical protein
MLKPRVIIANVLVLLATIALSSTTMAATYSAGILSPTPYINPVVLPLGSFSDRYDFTIASLSDATASVTNSLLYSGTTTILNIPDLTLSIFKVGSPDHLVGSAISGVSIFGSAPAGDYYATITGTATGISGGMYTIAMAASSVPVPASAWLLGPGLLGLVGLSLRKHKA